MGTAFKEDCFASFTNPLHELLNLYRFSVYRTVTHIIRRCTSCDCITTGTKYGKGLSFMKLHIPEIKIWAYTMNLKLVHSLEYQRSQQDFFSFGWTREIWEDYNEHGYSIKEIIDSFISRCKHISGPTKDGAGPYVVLDDSTLSFQDNGFLVDDLISYILHTVMLNDKPVDLDTIQEEPKFDIKHIWLDVVTGKRGFSPDESICIYCGYTGTPMMQCSNCSIFAHGAVKDMAARLPGTLSCAQSIDNDTNMRCLGPYNDPALAQSRQDAGMRKRSYAPSNPLQLLPICITELNRDIIVDDGKVRIKLLLQNTFDAILQREQVKLDQDIEVIQLVVNKATFNGNIHAVNTILVGLPESFAQTPMLRIIAKEATSIFYTAVKKKVEELTTNLNSKITEMNESFGYEVFISLITELLSSCYHDKVTRKAAGLVMSVNFIYKPLNSLEYKKETEELLCELHKWAWTQIKGLNGILYTFNSDTHMKIKNAINHNKMGLEMEDKLDSPHTVWFTLSHEGSRKVELPFNRRFVTIYVGLCLSQTTKRNSYMQACLKVLNNEVFSMENLDTMPDSLWRQIFSLVQPTTDCYEPCSMVSLSALTGRRARHFLSDDMVRTLLEISRTSMEEFRSQRFQANVQTLNTFYSNNALEVLERVKSNKSQTVQELLTSATGEKEQANITRLSEPQPTTNTTNATTDEGKSISSKRSRRRRRSKDSSASHQSSNISSILPTTSTATSRSIATGVAVNRKRPERSPTFTSENKVQSN
jgi:hypothetical protein